MPRPAKSKSAPKDNTANLGFEAKLRLAADRLRNNMDEALSPPGQDKWARRQRPFSLAKRARRVRLRGQQPKQSNATTRRLAIMNLAIRGTEADFGPPAGAGPDTFRRDLHPDLRADYVLANPPFNDPDTALRGSAFLQTGGTLQVMAEGQDNYSKDDDVRRQFGVRFAFLQSTSR